MKKMMQLIVAALLLWTSAGMTIAAEKYNNDKALTGVRETNVYFDVNIGEPAKLLTRLHLIDVTYNQLVAAETSPHFVIGIRGKASNFFTKDDGYVLSEDLDAKKKIAAMIEIFRQQKFQLEQCNIAAEMQNIASTDFLPQIEVVANGYVSMIGYQSKGYAFVPMD